MEETNKEILTVSQLNFAIKQRLESSFRSIFIQGEVSNCKYQSSGHLYFSLKDEASQLSVVMFRGDLAKISVKIQEGSQVIVQGEVNVYPPTGKVQIIARGLKLVGIGELLLKLEALKRVLHQRGWFRKEHKRPLPKFPKRIGVVTSPTGAVIQDILNVLTRRFSGFHLILNPVKVQGNGSAEEIAEAINAFNRYQLADVLIVGRGGGSIEDLWAFNEEKVALAIFESQIPIISAVGHETDHCIADYVADVRAPTPSAAAEIAIAEKQQHMQFLKQTAKQIDHLLFQKIEQNTLRLKGVLRHPLFYSPYALIGPLMQRLDSFKAHLEDSLFQTIHRWKIILINKKNQHQSLNPGLRIQFFKDQLKRLEQSITQALNHQLLVKKTSLQQRKETLEAVNPKRLLTRGYTILFQKNQDSVITSVHNLKKGQEVRLLFADGQALSTIDELLFSHDAEKK